ncbi:MAG: alkaline phosphatase family protein, partial [Longimicrobiales bacterium]
MRAILVCILLAPLFATAQERDSRALIIVIDGLRPDYITPALMPNLYALGERGVFGDNHHSVVPTVTRVNSPSIATGSYPRTHGIMGNSMYVPEVRRGRALNTGDRAALLQIQEAYGGELLTAPSLGEILHGQGKVLFAASSGSSGSGFLLNHRAPSGALVHTEYVVPDTLEPLVERVLGPFMSPSTPGIERARRALDAVLLLGVDHFDADAIIAWFTEPDGTTHATGVGSPQTL